MFLLVTIVALAISLAVALLSKDPVITLMDQENRFSFQFRQKLLKASPRWRESEKNPPLSLREAMRLADEICDKFNQESKKQNLGTWGYDSLNLSHLNAGYRDLRTKNSKTKWCYVVHFQTIRSQQRRYVSQDPETISFIILMDGTIVIGESLWTSDFLKNKMLEHYPPIGG